MKTSTLPRARELPKTFEELVRLHLPRAIHDETDYENTREIIERLVMIPKLTRGQVEYLDTLTVLFSAYEREHYLIDTSDITPEEMLGFLMDQHSMSAADLGRLLGVTRSAASLLVNGKRQLTMRHIRKLCEHFQISADIFL